MFPKILMLFSHRLVDQNNTVKRIIPSGQTCCRVAGNRIKYGGQDPDVIAKHQDLNDQAGAEVISAAVPHLNVSGEQDQHVEQGNDARRLTPGLFATK